MDYLVFNFFSDTKEEAAAKLSAYPGKTQTVVEKALVNSSSIESFISDLHIDRAGDALLGTVQRRNLQ